MKIKTCTGRLGHGDTDMETWRWGHGHGDMQIKLGNSEVLRKDQTKNGSPGDFSFQTVVVVCHLFDEETDGSYPFVSGLNGLDPSMK